MAWTIRVFEFLRNLSKFAWLMTLLFLIGACNDYQSEKLTPDFKFIESKFDDYVIKINTNGKVLCFVEGNLRENPLLDIAEKYHIGTVKRYKFENLKEFFAVEGGEDRRIRVIYGVDEIYLEKNEGKLNSFIIKFTECKNIDSYNKEFSGFFLYKSF